ncbi:uncharacterized protein LOC111249584 isoform X3 [Varroa destructor]|uniref:Telomeric repeat-binding factor 2-interacting protein 1 n=1 Tax=Varroa destructor TaxID=109461 RepID=A0A7M7K239_VARDE|nr:uncharacterized protein LOC111249584 isoform X3 [Varroa destructor]
MLELKKKIVPRTHRMAMTFKDIFEYDCNWPPKSTNRTWAMFTQKEDKLILEYLLKTHQFTRLGGNEVWKKLATSRKFNPGQRTFHSLRERYRKYLISHLGRYLKPRQQELLLGKLPGSLSMPSKMTSKKEAVEEQGCAKLYLNNESEYSACDSVDSQTSKKNVDPENNGHQSVGQSIMSWGPSTRAVNIRNALRERADLVSKLSTKGAIVSTSTPAAFITTEHRIVKANLLAENFQTSSDDAIQNPNAKIEELLEQKDTKMEMKQFHMESSTPLLPLKAPRELQCDEGPHDLKLEIYDAKQVEPDANHILNLKIRNELRFSFKFAQAAGNSSEMTTPAVLLSHVQHELQNVLLGHAQPELPDVLPGHVRSFEEQLLIRHCKKDDCVGLEAYLDCWVDLQRVLAKAERHDGQWCQSFYARLLMARVNDLLVVPMCTRKSICSTLDITPDQLYSFFKEGQTSEQKEAFRQLLETTHNLRAVI